MKVVTRYAPSPTGPQHIGGLRTALYCYLFAKKHGGEFILRIEDTDQNRFVPGAEEFIVKAVNWAGFQFTQGVHMGGPHAPYRQSERSEIYRKYAWELVESGKAYIAFDTQEEIDAMKKMLEASGVKSPQYNYITRSSMKNSLTLPQDEVKRRMDAGDPFVIRFMVPRKEEVRFQDEIRNWVVIHTSQVDDKVLLKSDGLPTYHLANVVDDHLMEVTHVIRGEEWLPSTPLHVLLYHAFGWQDTMPKFAHLPLLLNPDGSKMSKRNSAKFGIPILPLNWMNTDENGVQELWEGYADLGYFPEAFINFLALMGWSPGHDLEIMSLDQMVEHFSLDRVSKSGAKFDMDKLLHFNQVYLRAKPDAELLPGVKQEIEKAGIPLPADEYVLTLIRLLKDRVSFVREFVEFGPYFFSDNSPVDAELVKKKWNAQAGEVIAAFLPELDKVEPFTAAALEASFKSFAEARGLKTGQLMMPLRIAISGMGFGPHTFEIAEAVGREGTARRIQNHLAMIAQLPA